MEFQIKVFTVWPSKAWPGLLPLAGTKSSGQELLFFKMTPALLHTPTVSFPSLLPVPLLLFLIKPYPGCQEREGGKDSEDFRAVLQVLGAHSFVGFCEVPTTL